MKRFFVVFLVIILCVSLAPAQQQGQGAGKGPTQVSAGTQDKAAIADQVRNRTQEHKALLDSQLPATADREILQNQNRVRVAAMALNTLQVEAGLGQNLSEIATGFNNSAQVSARAEERINQRQGLMRALFGGDENAARTLQAELNQNQVRLQQLQMIHAGLDPEYQGLVTEQMQIMEQEQMRLRELADREAQDRGLLGWLFK